ncbi:NAD(P)-dependent dehydrogenase (short-subunit alcohol dehydrogenase family) [Rhizobium sp. BK077]|uniref:SDR family oxidoreductase n=1 Tax=Rhizobium TaxID=379 RepID=UPI00041AC30D|nr:MULTISPECIES: SDR family oxidoreductase [Rhizobium]KZS54569.1 short-chain dehydrogenase [Rhizobium anhuiense bv. trifolii]MBB3300739.1 NAD(P)-dependent dehydrogenase (short-subunit alcohol dehydrogenase family) [Rhizobium sp. BK112]MBB3370211.1 NAD(P)-dependent dehydrogenase (short-subunit alcohol dehydrogenase family) [Rhizobium sp. BK077]MBB4180629.1 NAD(P)-dependent dehydrogenase (short-subunit alcohol dehydrogenase family) [Rhizobium sp. BK109]PDS36301.1 short chain dehydrogenase [Rhizo
MNDERLRTALITGSAKRIGRAIAEDLAANGFSVAIHANGSIGEAEELVAELRRKGYRAAALQADLTDIGETGALVAKASEALGPLDLLVNNASVFQHDSARSFNAATWALHFDLHVRAPSILAAAFAQQMPAAASGLIVNIIDQRVWALRPSFYSYTLSKSALWTATQTLAQALAPRIRVNAIGPGPSMPSERQAMEDFQAQVSALILQRGPALKEFGQTIRFLYDTPSITGQMIALDGGQHLAWQTPDVAEITE